MERALPLCLAASLAFFVGTACKPGKGSSGKEAGNVFTLAPGTYAFVKASVRESKGAKQAQAVAADSGTGKTLRVARGETAGSFLLTDTGKYVWSMPGEKAVNVDCTAGQDVFSFEVYSVVESVGRIGGFKAKRGCRLDPEPTVRSQWRAVSLSPQSDGGFALESEANVGTQRLTLVETFARVKSE